MSQTGNTPEDIEKMKKAFDDYEDMELKEEVLKWQNDYTQKAINSIRDIINDQDIDPLVRAELNHALSKIDKRSDKTNN